MMIWKNANTQIRWTSVLKFTSWLENVDTGSDCRYNTSQLKIVHYYMIFFFLLSFDEIWERILKFDVISILLIFDGALSV